MKTRKSILFFWALFLVPALLMAGAGFVLLKNEQERMSLSALQALSRQAVSVSETIHLTIETVQENLESSLLEIPLENLKNDLIQWEMTNPLVRNVFIYHFDKKMVYPARGMAATYEEQQFTARYDSLFQGRFPFDDGRMGTGSSFDESGPEGLKPGGVSYPQIQSSRKKLLALSRKPKEEKKSAPQMDAAPGTGQTYIGKKGWIPWFSENRLFLLGWVQPFDKGPVYGIELELMTLLSRLVLDFPTLPQTGATLALIDGNANVMHQSGPAVNMEKDRPVAQVPVSRLLPHWQMAVFTGKNQLGSTRGFLYVSVILLGIFIAAIVSGGILLTRLTLANIKDARQKTSFVSSVSHELKTPLTSIRMVAELMLSGRVKEAKKIETYLSVIVSESRRLTRLINNVLDFGKLEQGQKRYQFSCVDISGLVSQIIEANQIRIREKNLEIIEDIDPGDYQIVTDADAVEQVILNLLDNALKYAASGRFIQFILTRDKQGVALKICDDGPGIPVSHHERVFDKFHRLDDSLTASQPGSGLGLSIARQLLNDLGGDLTIETGLKKGCCFAAFIADQP